MTRVQSKNESCWFDTYRTAIKSGSFWKMRLKEILYYHVQFWNSVNLSASNSQVHIKLQKIQKVYSRSYICSIKCIDQEQGSIGNIEVIFVDSDLICFNPFLIIFNYDVAISWDVTRYYLTRAEWQIITRFWTLVIINFCFPLNW